MWLKSIEILIFSYLKFGIIFNNRYDGFIYKGGMDYELDLYCCFSKEQSLSVIEILDGQIEVEKAVVAIGNPLGEENVITSGHILRYGKNQKH